MRPNSRKFGYVVERSQVSDVCIYVPSGIVVDFELLL
jgi:hypothetical protein